MAKFSFYYRSEKKTANVSIRFVHKGLDYVMRTPFVSEKRYWIYKTNKKGKPVKSHKKIEMLSGDANLKAHKAKLLEFKERLILLFEKDSANGTVISKDWLKQAINDSHSVIEGVKNTNTEYQKILKQQELLELNLKRNLLKEAITTIYSKYASNEGELKKFKTTFCWIEKFEKYNSKIYNISDFNQQFIDSFKSWATIDEGYRLSTAINHLKRTKRAIEYVYFNDTEDIIKVHKQLSNLKFTSSNELEKDLEKIVVTLNFNELDKIEQFDFSNNNSLHEAQKCILIGCETGLRFSDFNKLNESNYKRSIDGIEYWEFKTSKTKKWVQITNSDRLKYLTNKYGLPNTSYSENDDISLNRQIKRVCLKVGLKDLVKGDLTISEKLEDGNYKKRLVRGLYPKYKLMTTRTFRRSFATNYYGKIPISDIIRVTGHATERMLRNYINATDDKNISIAYKNINEFHKKRQEEIKLKKVD